MVRAAGDWFHIALMARAAAGTCVCVSQSSDCRTRPVSRFGTSTCCYVSQSSQRAQAYRASWFRLVHHPRCERMVARRGPQGSAASSPIRGLSRCAYCRLTSTGGHAVGMGVAGWMAPPAHTAMRRHPLRSATDRGTVHASIALCRMRWPCRCVGSVDTHNREERALLAILGRMREEETENRPVHRWWRPTVPSTTARITRSRRAGGRWRCC